MLHRRPGPAGSGAGESVDAAETHRIGLVNRMVPDTHRAGDLPPGAKQE